MRLFVALEIPADARHQAAELARSLSPELPKARWVRGEHLHGTLIFLGEVETARVDSLTLALRGACAVALPLALVLRHGGTFPPRRPARVAWLGLEGVSLDALTRLRELVSRLSVAAAGAVGFVPETRPFHPHVTLARPAPPWPHAAAERFALAAERSFGEPFEVESVTLMESELGPGGARYRQVERFPLGAVA